MTLAYLILLTILQVVVLFALRIVLIVLGIFITPIGLLFSVPGKSVSDGRDIDNFPKWLWVFGNDSDGTYGDKRLWWDKNADASVLFGLFPFLRSKGINLPTLNSKSFLSRYWWCAFRNPVNNLRWVPGIACPVSECKIIHYGYYDVKDELGKEGWQFVAATHKKINYSWCGLYIVYKYPNTTNAFELRFGYKIKPAHAYDPNVEDKGFTVAINPWKDLT